MKKGEGGDGKLELDKFLSSSNNPTEYNFEFENEKLCKIKDTYSRYFVFKSCNITNCKYENALQFAKNSKKEYGPIADPDGTLGTNKSDTCMLSRELYRKLWGWEDSVKDYEKDNLRRYGFVTFDKFGMLGPDTMNSAQTTVNRVVEICEDEKIKELKNGKKISINFILELYSNEDSKKALIDCLDSVGELKKFLDFYHTLGNFVLVPAYFNVYRNLKVKDYWDKSLILLKQLWDKDLRGLYIRYVNYFFLWDYNEGYNPKRVSDFQRATDMENFLETTCRNIRRRGNFMVAMLKIQKINPNYYLQLVENIFNTENKYQNYEEVIEAIKNQSCYSNKKVKDIIDALVQSLRDKAKINFKSCQNEIPSSIF
jgi:hypothetical protein